MPCFETLADASVYHRLSHIRPLVYVMYCFVKFSSHLFKMKWKNVKRFKTVTNHSWNIRNAVLEYVTIRSYHIEALFMQSIYVYYCFIIGMVHCWVSPCNVMKSYHFLVSCFYCCFDHCLSAPDGPHVGPMNLAIRVVLYMHLKYYIAIIASHQATSTKWASHKKMGIP